ncbi:MAG: aminoglycoside phosphotransferase family protein [Chloroflexi bacterium]|nr:aminoglycoside phosphotransferase family protein [Chloroflexota bacterium]
MPTIKPTIALEAVQSLLVEFLGDRVTDIAPIAEGQISRVFACMAAGQGYIIRFAEPNVSGFQKEQFLFTQLTPQQPRLQEKVAPPIHLGHFGDYEFIITRRLAGQPLTSLTPAEYQVVLPSLIETHYLIQRIDVGATAGYGHVDNDGQGLFDSWPAFILDVREEQDESLFYGKWHHMFDDTFLNRAQFDTFFAKMEGLLTFCPSDRWLIHGDYGFDNVLALDGRVTGVIDWSIKYGDFLMDIGFLQLWTPDIDYAALVRAYYQGQGLEIPNLTERVRCYELYVGLEAMKFFAKTNQQPAYEFVCKRLTDI